MKCKKCGKLNSPPSGTLQNYNLDICTGSHWEGALWWVDGAGTSADATKRFAIKGKINNQVAMSEYRNIAIAFEKNKCTPYDLKLYSHFDEITGLYVKWSSDNAWAPDMEKGITINNQYTCISPGYNFIDNNDAVLFTCSEKKDADDPNAKNVVFLYKKNAYTGDRKAIGLGDHNLDHEWNDKVKSIYISNNFCVKLYKDKHLKGESKMFCDGELKTVDSEWNNIISSIQVFRKVNIRPNTNNCVVTLHGTEGMKFKYTVPPNKAEVKMTMHTPYKHLGRYTFFQFPTHVLQKVIGATINNGCQELIIGDEDDSCTNKNYGDNVFIGARGENSEAASNANWNANCETFDNCIERDGGTSGGDVRNDACGMWVLPKH
jgi:hypothetical protein